MEIDLDAARAARAEAEGEHTTIIFGGETFTLPREFTFSAAEAAERGDWRSFIFEVLDGQAETFFSKKPTLEDFVVLGQELFRIKVGAQVGEAPASSRTSARTGSKSNPRSKQPTEST